VGRVVKSILAELGKPTVIIPGLITALLLTCGVYLWLDSNGAYMYAGLSERGLSRPLEPRHPGRERGAGAGLDVDTWTLWFWSLPKDQIGRAEARLKWQLRPRFNGETMRRPVFDQTTRAAAIVRSRAEAVERERREAQAERQAAQAARGRPRGRRGISSMSTRCPKRQ
jgi:hypothetical protein